jgi:hypothetical protein
MAYGDIVTLTIEEDGNLTFLATDAADVFLEQGRTITKRASHVEPADSLWLRIAFHLLRLLGNKNRIAAWTRTWPCRWRVNTKPVGGPVLTWRHCYSDEQVANINRIHTTKRERWQSNARLTEVATWTNRQDAIDAEIKFLNDWFAERG